MSGVIAPHAPGRLGEPVEAQQALKYLHELGRWISGRRQELDALDQAVLSSPDNAALTGDIRLGLALWQAVKNRHDLLLATWDSGRVADQERRQLATLIWGRLDTTVDAAGSGAALQGMSVSLPEACRLSDALVGQLRTRLNLDPAGSDVGVRIRDLRATVERLRDQAALEPVPAQGGVRAQVDALAQRTEALADKAGRGGDVGGLLGPLEIETSTLERDLIVGGVQRRRNRDKLERAREMTADLQAREPALGKLVEQTVRTVDPAPKYAVPDVSALGPLPNSASAIDAYLSRLDQVNRAMQLVQSSYQKALGEHEALLARVDAARAVGGDRTLTELLDTAGQVLALQPCPIAVAQPLVEAVEAYRRWQEGRR